MERLRHCIRPLVGLGLGLSLQACTGLGYQGGVIPTNFGGITLAQAVSPQTLSLSWNTFPGAAKYNVYAPDQNLPLYTPGFNTILFKPIPSDPTLTYQYSVTAADPVTGIEQGNRANYTPVQLLPHFNFQKSGSVTPVSKTSIRVNWTGFPGVSYLIYVAERLPTGQVNYNNFVSSSVTIRDQSSTIVTGLLEGREYCAIAIAQYADLLVDGPDGNSFTGDTGTKLSSASYSVGASGNFGDSVIAQAQKCARTVSNFDVSSIKIYAPKATLSNRPVFYVSVPGDITEDSAGSVTTTMYQMNETTGLSSLVGSRVGTGRIISQASLPTGRYKFFAIINDLTGSNAQAKLEILVAPTYALPPTAQDRKYVYIRSFNTIEDTVTPTGYYPEKQQGGYGSQQAGTSVAIGDFNCDGKMDIAVGIPQASVMAGDNRPAKQGKVIIYYDSTSATPSSTTRSQIITFDISGFAGTDASRDLQLGTSLYVGNFNNDNQQTNQPVFGVSSGLNKNFRCDDLVIGSGYGPMFVLYGKRDISAGDGGLNYIGPTSFTINPSASCDPTSNVCQPAAYTYGSPYSSPVGGRYTSGDYNGDGYEDLVSTSGTGTGVWVYRGSEYGLIAPAPYAPDGVQTTAGPYLNYPYLSTNVASFTAPAPVPAAGWGVGSGFGTSLSTLHNAYYDTDSSKTYGSKRIRDVLLIGNSNLVHACVPKSDYTAGKSWGTISGAGASNDVNSSFYWDCSNVIPAPTLPTTPSSIVSGFGAAMADIKNALLYRPDQYLNTSCPTGYGNCSITSTNLGFPGAVAISSVANSAVYIFYGVNNPATYTPASPTTAVDRDTLGINRNNYLNRFFAATGTIAVTSTTPCFVNSVNFTEDCLIQQIKHPTSGLGSFGYGVSALPGNVSAYPATLSAKDTILAVTAPFKSFTLSNLTTYNQVGSVQLFAQNSRFSNNPIVVRGNSACDATMICRYSDGFSNTLTTALDYDGTLTDNIHFGLGGIVAGPLIPTSDLTYYNSNSDIVIGAPGHVARISNGASTYSVIDSGAAFSFFSQGGVYRNYRIVDSSGPTPWHSMDQSFSQESDMKFHQAISIGDINQDGIGDVAVRISQGSRNSIRIYNGTGSAVGFDRTPGGSTTFQVQGDRSAGIRFVPVGKITNSNLPAFFISGTNASYLFFAGIGGLVQGFPSSFGVGGTPRKLFAPSANYTSGNFLPNPMPRYISYLDFSDTSISNSETLGLIDTSLNNYTPFAHGDFNGDGYEDFAIGFSGSQSIANTNPGADGSKACFPTNNYCGTEGAGRVMIFYGGADNGFQTQPDSSGGYPLTSDYFSEYHSDLLAAPAPRANFGPQIASISAPCAADGTGCKIQMLHEGGTFSFGSTVASVPVGNCTDNAGVLHPVSALAVASKSGSAAKIFIYRPRCLDSPAVLTGLVGYNDATSAGGLIATQSQLDIPVDSSPTLGVAMTGVQNLMGPAPAAPASGLLTSHLVVADQGKSRVLVYPVHQIDSFKETFETYKTSNATALNDGARLVDYSASAMMSGTTGPAALFGVGIADAGDINGDGFSDIALSIAKLARKDTSSQSLSQGTVLVLFGGSTGLQSHSNAAFTNIIEPARVSSCYIAPVGALPTSVCNPTLLYTPQATNSLRDGSFERTFLSPFSKVNVGSLTNEGLGTFLIGVPGKDSLDSAPNNRILQGGAFYDLP